MPTNPTINFSNTVNVVDDLGADPNGNTDVIPVIENNISDGDLLIFPQGTYLFDGYLQLENYSNIGLRAEAGANPTIKPGTVGNNLPGGELFIELSCNGFEFGGFTIDYSGSDFWGEMYMDALSGDLHVHDIRVIGMVPGNIDGMFTSVQSATGEGKLERIYMRDGAVKGPAATAIQVRTLHAGAMDIIDCELWHWPSKGIYASQMSEDAGPTSEGGVVHVDGGYFKNNNDTDVRVGSDGSTVKNIVCEKVQDLQGETVTWDNAIPLRETEQGDVLTTRSIRFRNGQNVTVENCDFVHDIGSGPGVIRLESSHDGPSEIINCRIESNTDSEPITVGDGSGAITIEDNDITGTGNTNAIAVGTGRTGTTISNNCISHSGAIVNDGGYTETNNATSGCESPSTSTGGGGSTTGGPITEAEADYFVDPVNGTSGATGTSVSDAVDSIYAFDENGSISLSPGDTVALLEGTDTLTDRLSLSFIGEMTTQSPVKLGDPNVTRNGDPITFGTFEENSSDYVLDGSNLGSNTTNVYQFKTNNVDWTGSATSWIDITGAKNHGMKLESPNEESQGGIYEYVKFTDYGNDSTSQGGNGIWVAEGVNGGVMRRCEYYDGSEPADSDGVYFGGPAGNRPGGWLFEYCVASYNADDGYDFFRADSNNPCIMRFCVAHHNGRDQATWDSGNTDGTSGAWGDGNGFKCAGDSGGNMWLFYCVAYMNKGRNQGGAGDPNGSGFDDNGFGNQRYIGCTSAYNEEWGIRAATSDTISLNCVAYQNGDGPEDGATTDESNSWDKAVTVTDGDFASLDPTADDFFVPVSGSDIVDAGAIVDGYTVDSDGYSGSPFTFDLTNDPPIPVTESYSGTSPDLGYAETGTTPLADGSADGGGDTGGGGGTTTRGAFAQKSAHFTVKTGHFTDTAQ